MVYKADFAFKYNFIPNGQIKKEILLFFNFYLEFQPKT